MRKPEAKNKWKEYRRWLRISEKYLRFKEGRELGRFGFKALAVWCGLILPMFVFIFEKPHFDIKGKGLGYLSL